MTRAEAQLAIKAIDITKKVCANCKFWCSETGIIGECRYDSPIIINRSAAQYDANIFDICMLDGYWPRTHLEKWCSKFEYSYLNKSCCCFCEIPFKPTEVSKHYCEKCYVNTRDKGGKESNQDN